MQSLQYLADKALGGFGSTSHIPADSGDYIGEDGLLHCGVCHAKKECIFPLNGRYHSSLIYQATVEEDRARLWDNKAFWQAVNSDPTRKGKQQVVTGTDMVDLLIPYAGTKQAIIDRIEKLSGYDGEEDADGANSFGDTVKN